MYPELGFQRYTGQSVPKIRTVYRYNRYDRYIKKKYIYTIYTGNRISGNTVNRCTAIPGRIYFVIPKLRYTVYRIPECALFINANLTIFLTDKDSHLKIARIWPGIRTARIRP